MRAFLLLLFACSEPVDPIDAGVEDSGLADASVEDAGERGTYGFPIRVPQVRSVDGMSIRDADAICTLEWQSVDALIYVQAHATQWVGLGGFEFETDGVWISDGTTASPIEGSYDYGGGHHNDSILADVGANRFRFYHSSFGFGFRACQPPDCIDVYDGEMNPVEYGCDGRTLPAICVEIAEDGAVPPLVDTFEKCPGDD
jgi:hypothetical protein